MKWPGGQSVEDPEGKPVTQQEYKCYNKQTISRSAQSDGMSVEYWTQTAANCYGRSIATSITLRS